MPTPLTASRQQQALADIVTAVKQHTCSLKNGCIQPVPGEGNPDAEIMFIGEAPGRFEDKQGRPFIGPAGKILSELLNSIGLLREDVYITNVVKCRPPANRDPEPNEIEEHRVFLNQELELIKPKLIVLLGRHAMNRFLPNEQISKCHGIAKIKQGQVYLPIYHPAATLHNPNLAETLRTDFKKIPSIIKKINKLPKKQ